MPQSAPPPPSTGSTHQRSVVAYRESEGMSADELLPVLAFILVQACIPNLLSEVHERTLALLQKNSPQPRDRFALTRCTALCVCVCGMCGCDRQAQFSGGVPEQAPAIRGGGLPPHPPACGPAVSQEPRSGSRKATLGRRAKAMAAALGQRPNPQQQRGPSLFPSRHPPAYACPGRTLRAFHSQPIMAQLL